MGFTMSCAQPGFEHRRLPDAPERPHSATSSRLRTADAAAEGRVNIFRGFADRIFERLRLTLGGATPRLRAAHEQRTPGDGGAFLADALAAVADDSSLPGAVDFQMVVLGREKELPSELHHEVYAICREALVNAFRHSAARKIEVEVSYSPRELRVNVRDNGCGISPEKPERPQSANHGLSRMSKSAHRVGGHLRLFSKAALGTEVELCVPLRRLRIATPLHPPL